MKLFLTGALCMALVTACAMGGKTKQATSPAPQAREAVPSEGASMPGERDPVADIKDLYARIEKEREDLGIQEPAAAPLPMPAEPMATPLKSTTDPTCKPAKNDTCTQSCTLSDSICDNAKRICDIAATMDKDAWAADMCAKATNTCKSAHEKCCNCQ